MFEITAPWRTSSLSGEGANCVEVAPAWRKSSLSGELDNCVEVAPASDIRVRDSKDPDGPVLTIAPAAWADLISAAKRDAFA